MSRGLTSAPTTESQALKRISTNERELLEHLRCTPTATRADLTRATGLTAQSISRIVDTLVSKNLIKIGKRKISGRGQPSPELSLNPDAAYSIGLSIMTDSISASLMNFGGTVTAFQERALPDPTLETILDEVTFLHDEMLADHLEDRDRLVGVGVSLTGYFVGDGLRVNPPDPLGELAMIDVDDLIAERLNLPVWLENDGAAAAIGETLTGVGRNLRTFAYLFFAMGVGGGVVIEGRLHRGIFGNAGEFAGILPPQVHDERPTMELLRQILAEHGTPLRDIKEMVDRFDPSWPGVDPYIERVSPHLSAMVSAISAVIDPEAIVLGGRIPKCLAERLAASIEFYGVPRRKTDKPYPKLVLSQVEGDSAAIGASAIPLKALFFR